MQLIVLSPPEGVQDEITVVRQMFEQGLTRFHLRKPTWSYVEMEAYLQKLPLEVHSQVVVHAHYKLLDTFNLQGVHLPEWRRQAGDFSTSLPLISTSIHRLEDLESLDFGFEYVFLSPIFDSISKQGYSAAFDLDILKAHLLRVPHTVIALGGVTADCIDLVIELGFKGVAVLGGVWQQSNPLEAFKRIKLVVDVF